MQTKTPNNDFFSIYDAPRVIAQSGPVEFVASRVLDRIDTASIHTHVIERGFIDVNAVTGDRQHMTLEEFESDVVSTEVIKFLAHAGEKVVAVMTVHIGLSRVTWVNSKKILKIQNKIDEKCPPLYIGTIVVDPTYIGVDRVGTELMYHAFSDYLKNVYSPQRRCVIFFDCVWKNVPFIPSIVFDAVSRACDDGTFGVMRLVDNNPYLAQFDANEEPPTSGHHYFAVTQLSYMKKL